VIMKKVDEKKSRAKELLESLNSRIPVDLIKKVDKSGDMKYSGTVTCNTTEFLIEIDLVKDGDGDVLHLKFKTKDPETGKFTTGRVVVGHKACSAIFSTVIAETKKLVKTLSPKYVIFTADLSDVPRVKFYERLLVMMSSDIGIKHHIALNTPERGVVTFSITLK